MATPKRNHTPKTKPCVCSVCKTEANAPEGRRHRHCKGKPEDPKAKGFWLSRDPFVRTLERTEAVRAVLRAVNAWEYSRP